MCAAPTKSAPNAHDRRDQGFTLLEVLVAVAILAAVLYVVPRSLVSARASVVQSHAWLEARLVAEEVLAEELQGKIVRPGTFAGVSHGRRWRAVITRSPEADGRGPEGQTLLEARLSVDVSSSRRLAVDRLLVGVAE
ncbi:MULTISPECIES: prepilin-type N-terminal cleavage/methylation domain-containing protein [unclassified Rhizobium]|uniref:type IV pilus modification PilV family protein n=1 Tax=unclassified Rhizobium TaxID=2613769 RepID=UPI0016181E39|nr:MULTISPECIES: prepilin-type N-terminal cleavage/methylation domain-containing protein [unclassified Rhizobium]MBB3318050.1 prepilin-type N-terminal cleavage/methylation domain-containing protein [Rhizobium sp. BK181]MCS3743004.1 prepilin-type N-terminal cleavage/methylation domain-containing protein [Rhizobium sp. BK661]